MFELLVKAELVFKSEDGLDILNTQKEIDKYRVCSGDNFTVFGSWLGYHTNGAGGRDPHQIDPWRGFVPVQIYRDAPEINYDQYKPCTGFEFS